MRKILFSIVSIVFVCSCGTGRRVPYVTDRDSIYVERIVERVVRDTVVEYILRDSTVSASVPVSDTSRLETDAALSLAWIDTTGLLNHTLSNKLTPLPVKIKIPEYYTNERQYLMRTVVKEVEKDFTHWQSFLLIMGKILLVIASACILAVVFFVMRKFRIFGL